jgi:YVTN family beta-propeller protein
MRLCVTILLFAGAMATAAAQTGDRVYTADQTSNTFSVIYPATNRLLGSIHLGEDVPAALSPAVSRRTAGAWPGFLTGP